MHTDDAQPWASGPGEILLHGLELLGRDTDRNRRLAMISIDNAVELMIKTFLGLPKRVTGITITRKEYQEISDSFPGLLDALEKFAPDKLAGIELGTIEWYHRLRNQLYHQGNGLTVERIKVEVYGQVATSLYQSLFGIKLPAHVSPRTDLLGEFILEWNKLGTLLGQLADARGGKPGQPRALFQNVEIVVQSGLLSPGEANQLQALRQIRNQVIHGAVEGETSVSPELVSRLREFRRSLKKKSATKPGVL
jgi:hypothetical protein